MSDPTAIASQLDELISRKGGDLYGGEAVTQEQHALQAALLAERDGQPPEIIVAALLHDIGHMLEPRFDEALATSSDGRHESIGADVLGRWFGARVTEPVRLHVAAKRYLCATRPGYFENLSPASVHSLGLQGGSMCEAEIVQFEADPHYRDAVQIRLYDDLAKDTKVQTPGLSHFLKYVETTLLK